MPAYRVYIEEISTRLFSKTVTAATRDDADALATAAIADDSWSEWDHSSSDASVELREELTETL